MSEGKVYKIGGNSLKSLERIFGRFKKAIEESSDDYSFFRGEIYLEEGLSDIFVDLLAGDIDGNYKRFTLQFSPDTNTLYLPKKFSLQRGEDNVKSAIMQCVNSLDHIQFNISKVYFDISPSFFVGRLIEDSKCDDMYIMYLIGESVKNSDVSGFNYVEASGTCGRDLCADWRKVTSK